MQVTPISFNGIFSLNGNKKPHKKDIKPKSTEAIRQEAAAPKQDFSNGIDANEFLKAGGKFWFDAAAYNHAPFDGTITLNSDVFHSSSSYRGGQREFMFVFLRDEDKMNILSGFEKTDAVYNEDGGRTIYYEAPNHEAVYVEDYSRIGKLQVATLERYDETPENKGKFISRTSVKFDETGTKILSTDVKVGEDYQKQFGYTEKKTKYDNGRKIYEEKYNTKDNNTEIEKRMSYYDDKGFATNRVDSNCKFYQNSESKTPYATCKLKDVLRNGNQKIDRYRGYRTVDFSQGFGLLRQFSYLELPDTIKYTHGFTTVYADAETNSPYAVETYDEYGRLLEIENHKEGTLTTVEYQNNGAIVATKNNGSGKVVETATFLSDENGLRMRKWDKYNTVTGKRVESKSWRNGGKIEEDFSFESDGSGTQQVYVDGRLQYETFFGDGRVRKKIYSETGEMAYISKTGNKTTKGVYDKDKKLSYIEEYVDDIAVKRTVYDEKGEIKEEISFVDGDKKYRRIKLDTTHI